MVAITVASHRQRVDRKHLITGGDQSIDPQATVGFDTTAVAG
jgi:hypothetical protein